MRAGGTVSTTSPVHRDRYSTSGVTARKAGVVLHTSEGPDTSYPVLRRLLTLPGDRDFDPPDPAGRKYGSAYHVLTRNDLERSFDQVLGAEAGPFAAPPLNKTWWHLCIPGYARQTETDWQDRESQSGMWAAAAFIYSRHLIDGFPLERVTVDQLRAGASGYCDHRTVSLAFGKSTHTDVGAGFPWQQFADMLHTLDQPEDTDMHREIWIPEGTGAVLVAWVDARGIALSCRWSGPGTDPNVLPAIDAQIAAGAVDRRTKNRPLLTDLRNVWLDGELPHGDPLHAWDGTEFAHVSR